MATPTTACVPRWRVDQLSSQTCRPRVNPTRPRMQSVLCATGCRWNVSGSSSLTKMLSDRSSAFHACFSSTSLSKRKHIIYNIWKKARETCAAGREEWKKLEANGKGEREIPISPLPFLLSIHLLSPFLFYLFFLRKNIFELSVLWPLPGCGRHVQQGFKPRGFGEIVRHLMPRVGWFGSA